jgi:hypothetical protein
MPYLIKDNKKIIFIRITRTGSTSLLKSFMVDDWDYKTINCDYMHRSFHYHVKKLIDHKVDINDIDYMFTILRDPIERLESFYRLICKRSRFWKKTYPTELLFLNSSTDTPININEWWSIFKDKIYYDHRSRPQAWCINNMLDYSNIDKDIFIYKKDTFKQIYNVLNKKLNINLIEKHYVFGRSKDKTYPWPKQTFSDKIKHEIRDLYKEDYKLITDLQPNS